jgi:glycosyltransferase involved in cell wall biosynthesis
MSKLVILTTHPIQYQAPLWQALARDGRVPFEVWFLSDHGAVPSYDREFDRTFAWDLDLLQGYEYRFIGRGKRPGDFWGVRLPPGFKAMLRAEDVSAIWLQGWQVFAYWQSVLIAKQLRIDVWMRGETNNFRRISKIKNVFKRLVLGSLFRGVDLFFYIGSANKRFYESYGVASEKLRPAPYCVDNARFRAEAEQNRGRRRLLRENFNIPEKGVCVFFFLKLIDKTRPLDVVEGCRRFSAATGVATHTLFVGSGHLESQVRDACKQFEGEGGSVTFAGFLNQSEIAEAYSAADCMVLPSDAGETWGLVVNEALASGLPCIASDMCGCASDLIAPADPKLVFPKGDTEALAQSLRHLSKLDRQSVLWPVEAHDFKHTIDSVKSAWNACLSESVT